MGWGNSKCQGCSQKEEKIAELQKQTRISEAHCIELGEKVKKLERGIQKRDGHMLKCPESKRRRRLEEINKKLIEALEEAVYAATHNTCTNRVKWQAVIARAKRK